MQSYRWIQKVSKKGDEDEDAGAGAGLIQDQMVVCEKEDEKKRKGRTLI